jgi:hypothetical protein
MHVNGRKIAKGATRKRIIEALQPGWHLVRVNWKKRNVHVADLHGRVKVIPLGRT